MKRFYNNTLIGGAFSKALRVVALLCVLLGFSSSAWGDTYYIDASCISGVQQISWLQYQNGGGDIVSQNTNFNGKTAFQFTANSGNTLKLQLKIVSGNTTIYPQLYDINLSGSNNCIELSLDGSTLSYKAKQGSSLKCAGACTPSATITGASLSADKKTITLSGSLTTVCSAKDTYYGWQYCTDGKSWSESNYVAGAPNNAHHSTTPVNDYSNTWAGPSGCLVPGSTYYFRAYAYVDGTFYSDNNTRSVTIPSSGGDGGADCSGVVYLKPNDDWKSAGAYFAVYMWNGSGDYWIRMTESTCPGLYKAIIPEEYQNFKFVRMNPNGSDSGNNYLNWENDWNGTGDLTFSDTGNQYTITGWDNSGKWESTTCTDGCNIIAEATNVLIARDALVNKQAKTATMYGYLKKTDCFPITKRGFYYCSVNDGAVPCNPTEASDHVDIEDLALERGEEFNATLSDVVDGKTYYYRAYAEIDGKIQLSQETRSFATDPCIPQECCGSKAIVYSINAAFTQDNECKLQFRNLQDAINHLKETAKRDDDYAYVTNKSGSFNLNQPVEMRVAYYDNTPDDPKTAYMYEGTSNYGITAGNENPDHINLIADFNKNSSTPENTLSIKPLGSKAKPWIHHIVIRNSKNIVLDSLCIYSDISGKGDNALEIDVNSTDWGRLDIDPNISSVAPMLDANITIQNSMIGSAGFTGVHVSCYGGITFKNNDFECTYPGTEPNDIKWGASAKFLACKDVKFIQNNFRGSQATLLWVQECQNMLFMNNVFWNTNTNSNDTYQPIAAVRLVHQFNSNTNDYKNKSDIKNISCFYNTFYLAEDKKDSDHNYNFFVLSNTTDSHSSSAAFDLNSIKFQYNNCYSYDAQVSGRSDNSGAFLSLDLSEKANFCPNNFWSEYDVQNPPIDGKPSAFAFGCSGNTFTNVKTQVCETTASGPASLIVNGNAMNSGEEPDITSTGIELEPNELTADRYLAGVRPGKSGWTYGAYQSKGEIITNTIYWVGTTDKWDDRNNWEFITEIEGKEVRQRVSCVNKLSEDLKVIIEEIGTVEVQGGRKWPKVPASFDANERKIESGGVPEEEQVNAGESEKFASTIELEYGAGLRGVENLNNGTGRYYDEAIVHFDADRDKWLLVGPIVRPFDTEKNDGTTRNVNSGDYFRNYEPQIYMHGTVVDGENISWGKTFGELNVDVTPDTVFAINASVLYGKYYDTAEDYLKYEGIKVDDKAPIPYTFTGRFAVEEYKTDDAYKYTLKYGADKIHLINNVYPCNIDAKEIEERELGTISVYDYNEASFVSTSKASPTGNVYIKAQNGFVFKPNEGKQLKLTDDILAEGSTRTRAGEIPLPTFSLNVDNANTTKPGASNIVVRYDEFLGESEESLLNTPKVFTRNSDTPEAYIIHNDGKYTRYDAGKEKVTIPLGVRLMKSMNLTFEKVYNEGYDEVVLVDTKTQKFYNLLKRTYTTDVLSEGDTEGRFYLNLTVSGDDDLDDEGDNNTEEGEIEGDDDITTDVEETIEDADINIYSVDNSIVKVISNGTTLRAIYVSDMAGRTDKYIVNGNYAELQLPVSSGVYTVHVIGDTASKIGKVILK